MTICVGIAALTLLQHTERNRVRRTMFVDELFVRPDFRCRGIGKRLLNAAARQLEGYPDGPPYHRVAVVVRQHAAQQRAARRLFHSSGMAVRLARRGMRDNHSKKTIEIVPLRSTRGRPRVHRNELEQYHEGPRVNVCDRTGGTPPFEDNSLAIVGVEPHAFLAAEAELLARMRAHHLPQEGGDGGDVASIVGAAHWCLCAYA